MAQRKSANKIARYYRQHGATLPNLNASGLSVGEFVSRASFPAQWNESHVQKYIAGVMTDDFEWDAREEIEISGGRARADIVVYENGRPMQVVEVKPILVRDKIYMAKGQATTYSDRLKCPLPPCIMGFFPDDPRQQRSTMSAAQEVRETGVRVVFINTDEAWYPSGTLSSKSGLDASLKSLLLLVDKKWRQLSLKNKAIAIAFTALAIATLAAHLSSALRLRLSTPPKSTNSPRAIQMLDVNRKSH